MTDVVTLTIDDVEVSVAKGTGLVEAALAAGIEIPVFCYEPRLGPPIGACRMCLCEVAPGPPKPQAACTLTAADGMDVKTAATLDVSAVRTTIPSDACSVQAACGLGGPGSIWQRHIRHAPIGAPRRGS